MPFLLPVPSKRPPPAPPRYSFVSRLFFLYLTPLLELGKRRPLEAEDLPSLEPINESSYLADVFRYFWSEELKSPSASLARALLSCFRLEFYLSASLRLIMDSLALFQPILLEWIIKYLQSVQNARSHPGINEEDPEWHGWLLSASFFLIPFIYSLLGNWYFTITMECGLKVRVRQQTLTH
jgi:ATP-binding cassette subfamily C (CFTR/MRP) protein 1